MYIYISIIILLVLYSVYKFIDAKKTNERNIKVGSELALEEINKIYNNSMSKEDKLSLIYKKIDYLKQCVSVLKIILVEKEIEKKDRKKMKILRVITLTKIMNYIILLQDILSEQKDLKILNEKINNISLSDIGNLDVKLNDVYSSYKKVINKKKEELPLDSEEIDLDNFIIYYKTFIIKEINKVSN